jgi:hypothetical protein
MCCAMRGHHLRSRAGEKIGKTASQKTLDELPGPGGKGEIQNAD